MYCDLQHRGWFALQKLLEIHQNFSDDLVKACGPPSHNPSGVTIADCFIMNKEKFLIYGEYCSNLIEGQERLDQLCLDPTVQQHVTVSSIVYVC